MITYYVYLIVKQRRLCITSSLVRNNDYRELMHISVGNVLQASTVESMCKQFCLGCIIGNSIGLGGIEVVNDIEEFK